LAARGWDALESYYDALDAAVQAAAKELADKLARDGISVVISCDDEYPKRLLDLPAAALPLLVVQPRARRPAWRRHVRIAQCVRARLEVRPNFRTRNRRARSSGVSGYARGVDMETQLGALEANGSTVIVLAEGITYFRKKRAFAGIRFNETNVLAISQFPPTQPWAASAAMTRNAVIAALSQAMLVVEAGEKGGTLKAGLQAIDMGCPVYAIAYSDDPPPGNEVLFRRGALPLRSSRELLSMLDGLGPP
jgi:DNA processing protein